MKVTSIALAIAAMGSVDAKEFADKKVKEKSRMAHRFLTRIFRPHFNAELRSLLIYLTSGAPLKWPATPNTLNYMPNSTTRNSSKFSLQISFLFLDLTLAGKITS